MLHIGEIEYANVYPLFHHLKQENGLSFVRGVPSFVNRMLRDAAVDIGPSSSIEYARRPEDYLVIPSLSISATADVKSVVLFSDVPIDTPEPMRVHLTAASETSVVLLKVLLAGRAVRYTHVVEEADAWLKIGDAALFDYYNSECPYRYDLGKLWYERTGLPFVFALWLVRREAAETRRDELTRFVQRLEYIKSASKENLAALIDQYHMKGLTSLQVVDYWETIDYNLSPAHIDGLMEYYRQAEAVGELKRVPKMEFFEY